MNNAKIVAVVGAQWGDEGKGKLVSILCEKALACGRYNGGANAGHSICKDGHKIALHLIPCGAVFPNTENIIGTGVVIHLQTLAQECKELKEKMGIDVLSSALKISSRAHLTFRIHMEIDKQLETQKAKSGTQLGTTLRGIGPTYSSKVARVNLRICDLMQPFEKFETKFRALHEELSKRYDLSDYKIETEISELKQLREQFAHCVVDQVVFNEHIFSKTLPTPATQQFLSQTWHMVVEAANAAMLDTDCGTYPYVTSSCTLVSGMGAGLAIAPRNVNCVIGVAKAYTTRVGDGPFPTELHGKSNTLKNILSDEIGKKLREVGDEYGATTRRPRRCGWFDAQVMRYSHAVSNYDYVMLTKLDVLSGLDELKIGIGYQRNGELLHPLYVPPDLDELSSVEVVYETVPGWSKDISKCRSWDELPAAAKAYVCRVEEVCGIRIKLIGVHPSNEGIIER